MSKKRTRSQKIKAQSKFQFSYNPDIHTRIESPQPSVKGYFSKEEKKEKEGVINKNKSILTADYENLKLIKKDLFKSLIVSSLMLCLIVVIYLLWYK